MPAQIGSQPHYSTCHATWGGQLTCHCGGCHHTFSGLTTFDKHRNRNNTCSDPAAIGLVDAGRNYRCWGTPSTGDTWWTSSGE